MIDADLNSQNSDTRSVGNDAVDKTKDAAAQLGAKVKASMADVAAAAKQEGMHVKHDLNDRVVEGSNAAADTFSKLADKLNEAKPDLENSWVGPVVQQAETSIRSVASYLHDSNPKSYLSDFAAFAKKNPTLAIGGAVAIGFLLSRAAKVAADDLSAEDEI